MAATCCKEQDRRAFRADVLRIWNERHGTELVSWLELPWIALDALLAARREVNPDVRDPLCADHYCDVRARAMELAAEQRSGEVAA